MTRAKTLAFWIVVGFQATVILVMVAMKQSVILYGRTIILKTNPVDPHSLFRGDYARLSFGINNPMVPKDIFWPPQRGGRVYVELAPSATSWNLVSIHQRIPETPSENHVLLRGVIRSWNEWSGHPVFGLVDVSSPGWLNTQPTTATWRRGWGSFGFGQREGLWYNSYSDLKEGTTVFVLLKSFDGIRWDFRSILNSTAPYKTRGYSGKEVIDVMRSPIDDHRDGRQDLLLAGRLGPYIKQGFLQVEYGIESYFIPEGKGRKYEQPGLDVEIAVSRKGHAVVKRVILPSGP